MTAEYIAAGFKCDKPGIRKLMYKLECEAFENKQLLNIEIQESDEYEGLDIYFTAYTWDGKAIAKYVIECKERPDTAHTVCDYWFMEVKKVGKLKNAEKLGYVPLYAYIWGDNYYAIWDINNWDFHKLGEYNVKPHTMGYEWESKKTFIKYGASLNTAIEQGYLS